MFGGVPWPAVTAATGGWILCFVLVFGLLSGRWFVSRREADVYLKRAEKAEANVEILNRQNAQLIAWAELGKSTFSALRERAAESEPT